MFRHTFLASILALGLSSIAAAVPVTVFTNSQGGNSGGIIPLSGFALAMAFTPTQTAFLKNAQVYIFAGSEATATFNVFLMSNNGSNPGSILETLSLVSTSSFAPVLIPANALGTTSLQSGTQYWIAVTPQTGSPGWGIGGSPATAQRVTLSGGVNGTWQSSVNVLQFVVNGDTVSSGVPEPGTIGLAAFALAGLAFARKRLSR